MKSLTCSLLLFLSLWATGQDLPAIRFGMVTDGPSPLFEQNYLNVLNQELATLLAHDYRIVFDPAAQRDSGYELKRIKSNLDQLLADPEVDIILCMGVLSTLEAAQRGPFNKPVFAPFGIDATLPIYPRNGDASGVANFNYMVAPGNVPRDVALLKRMLPQLKKVHLVVEQLFAEQIPAIQAYVAQTFGSEGLQAEFVIATSSAQEVLAKIPDSAQMVYVTPLIRFTEAEKQALYAGLAQRKIPSLALLGWDEVELGALAGLSPKSDTQRWFRRAALNIQRSLLGENPSTLPVLMSEGSKLVINMATARAVQWFPSWDLQISAALIHEEELNIQRTLTLQEAVNRALAVDQGLAVQASEVETAKARVALARANLKPQAETNLTGVRIDDDTSAASFGSAAKEQLTGKLKLSQVLYSDAALAGVTVQSLLAQATEEAYQSARLDLTLKTSQRYLNYLKVRSLARVRQRNLDLTNSHLETAKVRREVGSAGPAEVHRWEAQLANDKLLAIEAHNGEDQARYALNEILNEPQESLFRAEAPSLSEPAMRTGFGRIQKYVSNAYDFARFRSFMVDEALRDAPELARFDHLISAWERRVSADKRAFYLPTVALQGNLDHQLHRSTTTNPLSGLLPPGVELPQVPDTGWNVALNFSLPLFSGGARKQNLSIDRYGLEQLKLQREAAAQQIELGIRAGLQDVASASVGMQLRQDGAVAAGKNLDILDDAYAKGVASLIDLLDAQNSALVAELAAANANYDYFLALMQFQRASGTFDFFLEQDGVEAFYQRLERFYQSFK